MREYYSIRDLTKEFGVTSRTLRYYEDEGLLQPLRRGRNRLYTQLDYNRLQRIMRAKRLNFTLSEISEILQVMDEQPKDVERVRQLLDKIEKKRDLLKLMRRDIEETLHELDRVEETSFERLAELGVTQ